MRMIKSRHTNEQKEECVNEYLNGVDKYYLSGKYSVSIRTIDRWIASASINEVKLRIVRRAETIPTDIQHEILNILNNNPIFYGYNTSKWNENRVINTIKIKYGIEVNRRMAKALMEDAIRTNNVSYEDRVYSDIEKLDALGYSIVLLDYIKIGRIESLEVEPLGLRKYTEKVLDVNLVVARADENVYLEVLVSELEITDERSGFIVSKVSDKEEINRQELQRKVIVRDKYKLLEKNKGS